MNNREKVYEIFLQNSTHSHSKIAKLSKVAKSSVGDILRRYKETQTIERKRGDGRKKGFIDKNKMNSIILSITRNPCQSQEISQKVRMKSFPCQKNTQKQGFEGLHQEKNSEAIN